MQDVVEGVVIEKVKERGIESAVEKNVVEIGSIKVLEDLCNELYHSHTQQSKRFPA
jgi:hypothetical protein